jgi:hypothetical protein
MLLGLLVFGLLGSRSAWPQGAGSTAVPAPSSAGLSTLAPGSADEEADDSEDEKPFKPHWGHELEFSHSNQQAGQNTNTLSYTGTFNLTENGDFLSAGLDVSTQKVEGAVSKTGTLTTSGGLGLGFFSPSLTLGFQAGESALKVFSGDLTMNFQILDPFAANLAVGGSVGSHQVPVSQIFSSLLPAAISDNEVNIQTASLTSSVGLMFEAWDWWTISTTVEAEYDITYSVQFLPSTKKIVSNLTDHILALTLGLDFTIAKGWVLGISPQAGQEYSPAGFIYDRLTGGLVFLSTPTTQNFAAGTVSISYSFE